MLTPCSYYSALLLFIFFFIFYYLSVLLLLLSSIFRDWSGEPNNETADTDCVNINYGGYYEVNKCSLKYGFICQRPVNLPWVLTGYKNILIKINGSTFMRRNESTIFIIASRFNGG